MKNPIPFGRKDKLCEHVETIAGSASGIRRVVCKDCGNVSVSHIGGAVTKEVGFTDTKQDVSG